MNRGALATTALPGEREAAPLDRLDPRVRLLCTLAGSMWLVAMPHVTALAAACAAALVLAAFSGIAPRRLARRLLAVNLFLVVVACTLPFSIDGTPWVVWSTPWGALQASIEGATRAAVIVLSGNALVLLAGALVAPLDPVTLAQALHSLRVPPKLVQIMTVALRQIELAEQSRRRILRAMRARGFVARTGLHALRVNAHLVAALIAEAAQRAQRIDRAMRARGWRGHYRVSRRFRVGVPDLVFVTAFIAVLTAIGLL